MNHTEYITVQIEQLADKDKAAWWQNYLRDSIDFIGVGIPDLRKIILQWDKSTEELTDYRAVALQLFRRSIAEYKIAAILIYQHFILDKMPHEQILTEIEHVFSEKLIYDWNTCDCLCVRLLTPIVDTGNEKDLSRIRDWYKRDYYWHARAALVPFAQAIKLKKLYTSLRNPMSCLIQRDERFAKTAVGWVLREISKFDLQYVIHFLNRYKDYLTREVSRNALKYVDTQHRKELVTRLHSG